MNKILKKTIGGVKLIHTYIHTYIHTGLAPILQKKKGGLLFKNRNSSFVWEGGMA